MKKDPSLSKEYISAEHDVIYLPIPKNYTGQELEDFNIEDDSIKIYV